MNLQANTLADIWNATVQKFPNKTFLVFKGKKLTYQEVDEQAQEFAKFLKCVGVVKGDRIGFVLGNCPQFVIAYVATIVKLDAVVSAVNPLVGTDEVMATLGQSDPRFVITLENFSNHNRKIHEMFGPKMMVVSIADFLPRPINWLYRLKTLKEKFLKLPVFSWKDAKDMANDSTKVALGQSLGYLVNLNEAPVPEGLAVLQTTGGTTGIPKLAMLTNKNIVANCLQALAHVNKEKVIVDENTVFLGVMPFFHVYGLSVCLNLAFTVGATVVILPKFDSEDVFKSIAKYKADVFPAITRMYAALVACAKKDPAKYRKMCESLKVCVSGAGALDLTVKAEWEKMIGKEITEGYGLSEASPIVSVNPIGGAKLGSMGTLVPETELKLVHQDTGGPISEGEAGELLIRGPQVMLGYWQNEEETKAVIDADGWLSTGDVVRVDGEGFLWFVDRKKDMVKINGENVYPKSIEDVIRTHPAVADVAVFGLPDPKSGERLVACVVVKNPATLKGWEGRGTSLEEVIHAHCRQNHLSGIKIPKQVEVVEEIPKTIVGKVLKRVLKEKLLTKNQ